MEPRPHAAARMLRHARLRAGLTQRELARRAGVPQATVGRIEAGLTMPKFVTVLHLLNTLDVDLEVVPLPGIGVDATLAAVALDRPMPERVAETRRGMATRRRLDAAREVG